MILFQVLKIGSPIARAKRGKRSLGKYKNGQARKSELSGSNDFQSPISFDRTEEKEKT